MNPLTQYSLTVLAVTIAFFIVAALVVKAMRWARNRPPALGGVFWAAMFLSSGRMPPPPPQTQIEQETGEKKNREVGRGDDS